MKSSTRSRIGVSIIVVVILCFFAAQSYAQSSAPITLPRYQFFDSSGRPLASGCLFSYSAGTSNQLALYSDNTGSVSSQLTNPVILDASGSATFWGSAQAYKFILKTSGGINCSSGTQVALMDNVPGAGAGGGGSTAFSALTAASNSNAGTFAANGNTWDWSLATSFIVPKSAGFAPTASGSIGYDSTLNGYVFGINGTNRRVAVAGTAACSASNWVNFVSATAVPACSRPAASDLSNGVTGSGAVVLATSPTIATPVLTTPTATNPTINTGIANNGTGFQHTRFTCSATSGSCPNSTHNWPTTWADANYTTVCQAFVNDAANLFIVQVLTKATTNFGYIVTVSGAATPSETVGVDCIGVHD